MSAPLISIGPGASAQEIAEAFLTHGVKRLPVIEDGQVIGVVGRSNLVEFVEGIPRLHIEEEHGAGLLGFLDPWSGALRCMAVSAGRRPRQCGAPTFRPPLRARGSQRRP